jgi:sec-independent protein translocase protein TatA
MDIGPGELIILGIVLLLVFGGSKVPQLAKNLGKAKSEFEKGIRGDDEPQAASSQAEALPPPTAHGS